MQLGYVIHYVENVEDTLNFYAAAFGCTRRFITDEGGYGELNTGATTLAFASFDTVRELGKTPGRADPDAPTNEIAFVTDEVAAAFATAIAAGAAEVSKPAEMPWGQTVSYVRDLNGFLVEICSPVAN